MQKTLFNTLLIMACGLLLFAPAWAVPGIQVLSSGAQPSKALYEEVVLDMEVKVMGGSVKVKRQWRGDGFSGGRWIFNPEWDTLRFGYKYGATTDPAEPPDTIVRSEFSYQRKSQDSNIYVYDKRKTIVRSETGYRWRDRLGNWINYDLQGNMLAYGDRNNVTVSIGRDAAGRIETVRDHFNTVVLTFAYNGTGQVISVTDYTNRSVTYTYTGDDLTMVTDVRGFDWQYSYESKLGRRLLKSKLDPEGRLISLIHVQSAGGQVCAETTAGTWTYNSQTHNWEQSGGVCIRWIVTEPTLLLTTIVDEIGVLSNDSYFYDANTKRYTHTRIVAGGQRVSRTLNLRGETLNEEINGETQSDTVISTDRRTRVVTDRHGYQTTYRYDEYENPTQTIYPDDSSESWTYDPYSNVLTYTNENGVTEKNDYDVNGNLIRKTEALGTPVERITEYQYDAYGNPTQKKQLGDAVTDEAITSWTYDNYGNMLTKTDPENNTTEYTHDVLGNVLVFTDARDNDWVKTYDAAGNVLTDANPLGHTIRFAYDKVGNTISVTDALNQTTTYAYNVRDQRVSETDPYSKTKTYTYNSQNQLIKITDEAGHVMHMEYDVNGRLFKLIDGTNQITQFEYGAGNAGLRQISQIVYPTFIERRYYDKRGRNAQIHRVMDAGNTLITRYQYDAAGNLTRVEDPAGRVQTHQYDALNRLMTSTDPAEQDVAYTYDNRDNLLSVTNENDIVIRRYQYDRTNRQTREIGPDNATLQFDYDANGNLVERTDAKGQVIRYTYDAANRMERSDAFLDAADQQAQKTVTFSYNDAGSLTGYDDGQTQGTYTYDNRQRKLSETVNYGAVSLRHAYTYAANGQQASLTYPDGTVIAYTYDANNQLNRISIPGQGNITVNSKKWYAPEKITLPGGSIIEHQYDALMRLEKLTVNDPAENTLLDYGYSYNESGNITDKTTEHGAYQYGYDLLDRLTSAAHPTLMDELYSYDPAGNRVSSADVADPWQYTNGNQLMAYGDTQYTYDANGNTLTRTENNQTQTYVYDIENRLVEVHDNDNTLIAHYTYDPFGRRLSKTVQGNTRYFHYAGEGLIGEYDAAGQVVQTYGYAPDSLWGTDPVYTRTGSDYAYYLNDHLGTPKKIVNTSGATQWTADQTAFGDTVVDGASVIDNQLRFPGQYFDAETGLHQNGYRDYDPTTGRYLQSDPIGLDGGINTYLYANVNPVRYTDPLGLCPACLVIPGVCAGGACEAMGFGFLAAWWAAMNNGADDTNVIPFPERDKEKEKEKVDRCPPPNKGGDCTFTGKAGVVPSKEGYGFWLQCQYKCPRKGTKVYTSYVGIKTENPAFLCPRSMSESVF